MKKLAILFLTAIAITSTFNSCKKGEDDKFLSLRSRDARLMREWVLDKLESNSSNVSSRIIGGSSSTKTVDVTINISGTTSTTTRKQTDVASPGSTTSETVTFVEDKTLSFKFEKHGVITNSSTGKSVSLSQSSAPTFTCGGGQSPQPFGSSPLSGLTCDGTYNFTTNSESSSATGNWIWSNSNKNKEYLIIDGDLFYVKRLTSKELVLEQSGKSNSASSAAFLNNTVSDNDNGNSKTTWTFKAK
jgi:hypothetical protein